MLEIATQYSVSNLCSIPQTLTFTQKVNIEDQNEDYKVEDWIDCQHCINREFWVATSKYWPFSSGDDVFNAITSWGVGVVHRNLTNRPHAFQ